jgi:signal transduction histidine kinase
MRRSDLMPIAAVGNTQKMLGISLEELQTNLMTLMQQMANRDASEQVWKSYRAWDGTTTLVDELQLKDGQWVILAITCSADGAYDLISFSRSTELHDQIERYENCLSQVEEESQSKTSFLSRVSHEISTPMNGIIGVLTLARWILPHCSAALASFCASAAGKRENEGVPETPKIQPVSAKAEAILCLRNMRYFRCFELHR